ncbi:hypothetical protein NBRC116583_39120 [Arenicella sp. 4NH20-0111]|uniref:hypothetical protein n=1 Tax=Arenicella sp. 4NH20-0111 TaxID=3127648 RepID=UPI00310A5517
MSVPDLAPLDIQLVRHKAFLKEIDVNLGEFLKLRNFKKSSEWGNEMTNAISFKNHECSISVERDRGIWALRIYKNVQGKDHSISIEDAIAKILKQENGYGFSLSEWFSFWKTNYEKILNLLDS